MKIEGHTAWVTGAGSGLGEATARELARRGAKVAVLDINAANAEKVATDIQRAHGAGRAVACACDITDTASLQAALDVTKAMHSGSIATMTQGASQPLAISV